MRADPSNVDQLRTWDGARGAFWAERADRYDEGVAAYRLPAAAGTRPSSRPRFAAQLDGLAEADRPRALAALRATLADRESDAGVYYDSAAWLIEARRG
jgi:hypothetical protein